ncbi:MAG: protein kinase [Candidatus Aminicenantes bacterium]|nr:protein kinase [Candidatus Aminicenantes bacterium]
MKCSKCGFKLVGKEDICSQCGTPISKERAAPAAHEEKTRDIWEEYKASTLPFAPGDSFGKRYSILEEIGQGGMGKIFKARDKELEMDVALKMILPELPTKPDTEKRFKQEIKLARKISQENIIRIHDFGEVKGIKFISMEYIDGENLAELVQDRVSIDIKTVLDISKQICLGLKAAHKQGIIHRDLKPQNIMIDKKGKVYVTDFGLAKSLEEPGLSKSGIIMGTPQYLSPEQAKGEPLDQRSDIYTLGIIIYEMLTGRELFTSDSVIGYIRKHIEEKPIPPSEFNPDTPPYLERIVLKCLRKERSKRYRDASDILIDLEKKRKHTGRFIMPSRRMKKKLLIAAALILPVIALILYLVIPGEKLPPQNLKIAVMPFVNKTGDKGMDIWRGTLQNLLTLDLGQSTYYRVLHEDQVHHIMRELKRSGYPNSPGMLEKAAASGKVDYIILGDYSRTGDTFHIATKILAVKNGRSHPLDTEKAKEEHLFSLVDRLTKKIKQRPGLRPRGLTKDIDLNVEKLVRTTPAAYKYYRQGEIYYSEGKYPESINSLKKAIKIDPGFAAAFRLIAVDYIYLGSQEKADEHLRRALEFMSKAPGRDRYFIEASASYLLYKSPVRAVEVYREMLRYYPDDETAKIRLGSIYRNREEWGLAEEQFDSILKTNDRSTDACMNLVYINIGRGRYHEAGKLLRKHRHLFPGSDEYHYYLGRIDLYLRNYPAALREIETALSLNRDNDQNIALMGSYYHITGEALKAEQYYRQLIESNDESVRAMGEFRLGCLRLLLGQYNRFENGLNRCIMYCREAGLETQRANFLLLWADLNLRFNRAEIALEAIKQARKAASRIIYTEKAIDYQGFALYLRGRAYLQSGKIEAAKNTAAKLETLLEKSGNPRKRLHYLLNGFIALAEKKTSLVLLSIMKVYPLLPHQSNVLECRAFLLDALAEAYYRLHYVKDAKKYYKEITGLTLGRLYRGDLYALAFYRLGEISREEGEKEKALKNYETFLRLWKNADREIKKVKDAREQVAALKKGSD